MNMKSALVLTTGMASALTLGGCAPDYSDGGSYADSGTTTAPVAVCTDRNGNRVSDNQCSSGSHSGFVFLYMNHGGYVPPYGSRVTGASRVAMPGTSYSRASTISGRGGFGMTSGARGGFSSVGA